MAEKNSLWKNIRKKAEQNRRTGATPKKPTAEMLRQERKIKAKKYAEGGETDPPYRPLSIPMEGYEPDSVFYETPSRYSEPEPFSQPEPKSKPVNKKEDKPKPTSKRSEVQNYYLNQTLNQNSSTIRPKYIADRSTTATKNTPDISTKEWQEGPRDFNIVKGIQVALDLGQMVPNPVIAGGSYLASLPFTTYDVLDDLSKDDYKQAAVDALGYIPKLKNVGSLNTVIDATGLYNDVTKKAQGGPVGDDGLYNMQRALELGYTPDETGHWPSVDSETGMWLKSKDHDTAWMEHLYGYALNPEVQKQYQHPVVNPEGYFGENQLQYNKKAEGGFTGEDDDPFKSSQNQGSTVGKVAQDWYSNWVQNPEFAERLNRNFPSHASDLEKKIYGIKEARERASAANLKNINKVIPGIVSDIYDTQFLYNTNPEINTGLLNSYKSRLEDPKSIKALERNLSTNPQGFTDEQGRIVITNQANTQYGPQSVGVHELTHKVSERDKTLDKLFKGKFQTPSQDRIDANYDKDEMYPFLMQMRFDNKFQPGEEITPERLKQIKDSGYQNHLFKYYNDDEISKYLNTLASNQTQAPMQYAAQGGKLYPDGGSEDPPSGIRYIPPTRQDSLDVLNNAIAVREHYDAMVKRNLYNKPRIIKNVDSGKDIYNKYKKGTASNNELKEAIKDIKRTRTYIPEYKKHHNIDKPKVLDLIKEANKNSNYDDPYKVKIYDLYPLKVDISAPATIIDSRISPQAQIDYERHDNIRYPDNLPGGAVTGIPMYDPLAVTPWDMLDEKQQAERIDEYGIQGTPLDIGKMKYKPFKGFENNEPLKLIPIETPFSPSKVLIREMGNIDRNRKKGEKGLPELYMDDKKGWRPIEWNDYEMYKQKYPGANTPEGWIRNDQKANGGYMYPDGGKTTVYTDPKEFRKAEKNYNDSLFLASNRITFPTQIHNAYLRNFDFPYQQRIYANTIIPVSGVEVNDEWTNTLNTRIKPTSFEPILYTGHSYPMTRAKYSYPKSKPILGKPTVDRLQSKQYTSSNQQPGIVGNVENISPSEINMDKFYDGQYEKYRRSPYEDPMYRVWVPGQQMQIVPEEQFKKLNEQYALKDLEQKAQGGYMYDGGGPTTLYKKAEYDPNTGKILEYAGSQGNEYYVTPNTPQGVDFERRLPEFEIIEDTGLYNPNVVGPAASRYVPSETGLVQNPNFRAGDALEYVPIESALLPASLPFKATTRLGKLGVFGLETAIDYPGLGVGSILKNVNKNSTNGLIGSLDSYPKKYRQITESDAIAKAKNGIIERQIGFLTPDEIAQKVKDSDALTQDVIDINREWGLNLDNVAKVKYDEHVKTLKGFSDEENLIKDEFAKLQDAYNNNTISKLDFIKGTDDLNNRYRDIIIRSSKIKSDFDILLKNNPVLDKRYEEKLRALYDEAGIKQPDVFRLPNDLIENPNQILYPFSGQDISQFNFPQDVQNSIMSPYNAGFNRTGYSITKGDFPQSISYYEEILPDKVKGNFSFINPKNWFSKKPVNPTIYKEIRNNIKSPESLFQTVGHEDAHTWQRINNWGDELFTHYDPNYKYRTNHKNNPLSKEFADHMVEPTSPNPLTPDEPTYDTWLSGTKELHSDLQSARAQLVKDLRSAHGFTTKEAVAHLKQNYEIYLEYLIDTYDLKRFFKPNTPMETMKRLVNYLPAAIGVTATGAVGAKIMQGNQPEQQSYGGPINPYMYYSGGPMYYGDGGKVFKHIGAGAYGVLEGGLDTLTFGATDPLTDKGFDWLTKVGNKNLDLNDPKNAKFLRTQQQIRGYSNVAGAVGTAAFTGQWGSAIGQGAKGVNTAFQATEGLSNDFKKWSNISSQAIGIGAGLAGGSLNVESASKAGQAAANFGSQVSKYAPYANQAIGMLGNSEQPLWQQAEARQDYLNSPEYLAMKEQQNQAYVNQGLSFASHGGNINNNSLNLQNSMRDKYNSYRNRYSKGGTFQKFGINEIPDSAGLHHQNAYGGVPIGPNAMAEGGEFVLDGNYVVSDQVDGMNNQTDEFGRTMAENLKRDLSKYTMRDLNSKNRDGLRRPMDPLAEQTINQIKQKAMMETEIARAEAQVKEQKRQAMVQGALQYAAAGGKLTKDIKKIVEEEYAAAYGGRINPKKYKGLNIPKLKAKGGYAVGGPLYGNTDSEYTYAMGGPGKKWPWQNTIPVGNQQPYKGYPLPSSTDITSSTNMETGVSNVAPKNTNRFQHSTMSINKYNDGVTPPDTNYTFMTPNEDVFMSTRIDAATNKPIQNSWINGKQSGSLPQDSLDMYKSRVMKDINFKATGGMYGDSYARGGQIDYTNDMYASGGPMVGNAPQLFNGPAAQNRGGMLMAQGGMMMPQDDGVSKQIAAALQQGADPQQLLQQLIESGMDPQQAQLILEAIMDKMRASQPQAPMMAMGGTMYAPGGGVSNFQHMRNMLLNKTYRNAYNLAKGYNTIKPKDYPNVFTNVGETTVGQSGEWDGFYPATEDEAKQYQGYDPTKVNQSASTSGLGTGTGNENIFGNDKLGKALAIGQAAIPLGEAAYHMFNKPKHIKAPVIQPATVDYSASRTIDQRQTDMAENAYLNRLRNSSSTSGMFANNAKEYLLKSNEAQAGRNATSVQDQMNKNSEEVARANALTAQYGFSADQLNYDIDQARIGNIFGALNNAATTGFQGYNDISNRRLQEIQARSTQSANVTPVTGSDGKVYMATKGADGYYFNGQRIAGL